MQSNSQFGMCIPSLSHFLSYIRWIDSPNMGLVAVAGWIVGAQRGRRDNIVSSRILLSLPGQNNLTSLLHVH